MEGFTEAKSLVTGPIYFFDQMKPERKKWDKKNHEDHFPHLRRTSGARHSPIKNIKSKEVENEERLSPKAAPEGKCTFYSVAISQTPVLIKFPAGLKFSKTHQQRNLFEEYKLTAAEILCELGETLQIYAEHNITLPMGIANLVNYSWHDLIEGAYTCAARKSMLKTNNALQSDCNYMTAVDEISSCSRTEYHKENHLVKIKEDHHHTASRKSTEKTSLVRQTQYSHISQDGDLCDVIHFSLSSKIRLESEKGWIFQHPYSIAEILKWETVLNTAVKKLQEAIIQRKAEEAKLKQEGFNDQLIMRHYNDPECEVEVSNSPLGSGCFWLELLKRKPQVPAVRKADPEMKKFHYALLDGSSVTYQIISMMFNQDGGVVMSETGSITREWMWPSKGKLDDPVEIWVNKFISVKISGRFAIILIYKWHPQSLKLSLVPVKCKSFPPGSLEASFPDINPISKEARELFKAYKVKCKLMKSTTQVKDPSSLTGPVDMATFDPVMDISPMSDIVTAIKLRRLQRKTKHILFNWLNHYRFALGVESLHVCKVPKFPQQVIRKKKDPPAEFPLKQSAKKKDENKEYLLYRNAFLKLKGVIKPSPLPRIQKTPASNQSCRLSLPMERKDVWFTSHLVCPVVLRRILCGKEGDLCRCSTCSIPEVTDLEYDYLISNQRSPVDQIIIVCVFSAKEEDKAMKEVAKVYREQNRTRSMPCIQSRSDSFRFLKYNIVSASKFTGSNCPLLVQRHNVIPGIFLMYIQGKLLFANFIFNGYSTSAEDLQKQIVKTRNDYHMGYFLPNDFRIQYSIYTCCFLSQTFN